jgi:carboxymethylenebutenolidase
VKDQEIGIQTPDGLMPAVVCGKLTRPRAGVIIVHESFGVTDYITSVAERLSGEQRDWAVVAPHFFHRAGSPVFGYDQITPEEVLATVTADGLSRDIDAALDYLASLGLEPGHIGVVGFCMGGNVAFYAGATRRLGAAVTFYGGGIADGRFPGEPALLDLAPALETPWLGLFGDQDPSIPTAEVAELRTRLHRRGQYQSEAAPFEIIRYPDAGHGFHCDARTSAYHDWSARDSWRRATEWLGHYLPA